MAEKSFINLSLGAPQGLLIQHNCDEIFNSYDNKVKIVERNIIVKALGRKPIREQQVEIVERKGLGHPDSLADGIAESVSRALSREYVKRFGAVLHHNTDKNLLACGKSNPVFGGGEMLEPIRIFLAGRATDEVDGEPFPSGEVAIKAAKEYLKKIVPRLDIETDVEVECQLGPGSVDLRHLFDKKGMPKANDTSFGVGFAPLSELEKTVLAVERELNAFKYKKKMPALGPDIKVMGLRRDEEIVLTVAGAFVSSLVDDVDHYVSLKEEVIEKIAKVAEKSAQLPFEVFLNTSDDVKKKSCYITVTGTSLEMGDEGQVGRGNRVNGLITPHRPMSLEAAAGKNPTAHVGKIYNLLAKLTAERIAGELEDEEVHVKLLSQIGEPIDRPLVAEVDMVAPNAEARAIADEELASIKKIEKLILEEKLEVF